MKPNDQRNFVHKRIIGAVRGGLTGGIGGAARGFITSGGGRRSGGQPVAPRIGMIRQQDRCPPGTARQADRSCARIGSPTRGIRGILERGFTGGASGFVGSGAAVMGQYGAALQPMVEGRTVRTCLPGMVLAKDGLCYNRRDISNKEREYPRGTRPLGTPGEMAALRKAAAFGRRMETTVKRMQKIGVLKKAAPRKAKTATPKLLTPGVVQIQQE